MKDRSELQKATTDLNPTELPAGWLSRWPWATFLLPMIVYMLVGQLEPTPPSTPQAEGQTELATHSPLQSFVDPDAPTPESVHPSPADDDSGEDFYEEEEPWQLVAYQNYPYLYTLKIGLTIVAMLLVWPGYRTFRWQLSPWSVVVGVVGVVLWVGLCHLKLESRLLNSVGLGLFLEQGQRSAFNPLFELQETPLWAKAFLAIRLLGLALVVPVMEEFFLRGFLMRYVISQQWWEWPFGKVIPLAVLVGTGIPMLMHPLGELLATCIWFSLVTWLMVRTRNIWDCVVAHTVTNLLLGIYVIYSGEWQLM